jgi:hypothetical protein
MTAIDEGTARCPGCHPKQSRGETIIENFLIEEGINFQKEFSVRIGERLRKFDFRLQDGMMIEFDGQQHFSDGAPLWGEKGRLASRTLPSDREKDAFCVKNQIPLIRIHFSCLKNGVLREAVETAIRSTFGADQPLYLLAKGKNIHTVSVKDYWTRVEHLGGLSNL